MSIHTAMIEENLDQREGQPEPNSAGGTGGGTVLDATPCSAVDCSGITDNGCDTCVAYQLANEQLRADVQRLIVERNRLTQLVAKWRDMPAEEMRLRAGDMTAQEIRSNKINERKMTL